MPRTYATKTGGRGGCGSSKPFQDHRDPKPLFKETVSKRAAPGCEYHIEDCILKLYSAGFEPDLYVFYMPFIISDSLLSMG